LRRRAGQRIVFIGINSLFSYRHATALARSCGLTAIVETCHPSSRLKRLERRLIPSQLAVCARRASASFHQVQHRDDLALTRILGELAPDLVVVVGMGWLLGPEALAIPGLGTVNLHPALLPAYRGAEPTFWQLYDGVTASGVTAHQVDRHEDRGPIIRQRGFPVPAGSGLADLLALQYRHGPPTLVAAVRDVLTGEALPVPQPPRSPTRKAVRPRMPDPSLADWQSWDLERAWRVLAGVGPLLDCPPSRWRHLGWQARVVGRSAEPHGLEPGRIGLDRAGWFLAHPLGRLRLGYRWSPRAWLLALRRRGSPAFGIIAAETAAKPELAQLLRRDGAARS
jgi:methionyl-tRNA formyltransferase